MELTCSRYGESDPPSQKLLLLLLLCSRVLRNNFVSFTIHAFGDEIKSLILGEKTSCRELSLMTRSNS